jgi:hypothetical protein
MGVMMLVMDIMWNAPGFGPLSEFPPLRINCREFYPVSTGINSTNYFFKNNKGDTVQLEQLPLAINDTASFQGQVEVYIFDRLRSTERLIFDRINHDEIAQLIYAEAVRMRACHKNWSEILDLALQLQCLSVLSQGYGTVSSNHIQGMREYDYSTLGGSSYEAYDRKTYDRPLPPPINHAMDVALVNMLKRLEQRMHKLLPKIFMSPKVKPWYEFFVIFFILIWNMEYIRSGADEYIRSKTGTVRSCDPLLELH